MKKIYGIIVVMALMLTFVACGNKSATTTDNSTNAKSATSVAKTVKK